MRDITARDLFFSDLTGTLVLLTSALAVSSIDLTDWSSPNTCVNVPLLFLAAGFASITAIFKTTTSDDEPATGSTRTIYRDALDQ